MKNNTGFRRTIAHWKAAILGLDTIPEKGLRAAGGLIKRDIERNYRRGRDPYGHKWPRRMKHYPHPILNKTGRLFRGTTIQVVGDRLIVRNAVPYAHYHQTGTTNMARRLIVATKSAGLPESHRDIVAKAIKAQWKQNFSRKGIRTT